MKSKAAKRKANLKAVKAWRLRNPEKNRAGKRRRQLRYYTKNSDLIKAKARKWYLKVKNTKKYRRHCRERHLLAAYGLALVKVEALYKKQRGKCAICKQRFKKLQVDHCHLSGKIRGMLCLKCNVALGLFSDCIKSLRSAIAYLRRRNENRKIPQTQIN